MYVFMGIIFWLVIVITGVALEWILFFAYLLFRKYVWKYAWVRFWMPFLARLILTVFLIWLSRFVLVGGFVNYKTFVGMSFGYLALVVSVFLVLALWLKHIWSHTGKNRLLGWIFTLTLVVFALAGSVSFYRIYDYNRINASTPEKEREKAISLYRKKAGIKEANHVRKRNKGHLQPPAEPVQSSAEPESSRRF